LELRRAVPELKGRAHAQVIPRTEGDGGAGRAAREVERRDGITAAAAESPDQLGKRRPDALAGSGSRPAPGALLPSWSRTCPDGRSSGSRSVSCLWW
jgi:hypothetical protein